jgi:hypothetical protein
MQSIPIQPIEKILRLSGEACMVCAMGVDRRSQSEFPIGRWAVLRDILNPALLALPRNYP